MVSSMCEDWAEARELRATMMVVGGQTCQKYFLLSLDSGVDMSDGLAYCTVVPYLGIVFQLRLVLSGEQ